MNTTPTFKRFKPEIWVNGKHHQAVKDSASALVVTARARDGVIEAVEHTEHPWCIGVQWHPELQFDEPSQRRLFAAFVSAAAARRGDAGRRQRPLQPGGPS